MKTTSDVCDMRSLRKRCSQEGLYRRLEISERSRSWKGTQCYKVQGQAIVWTGPIPSHFTCILRQFLQGL